MKIHHLHTLKMRWLLLAMVIAVVLGEMIIWQLSQSFGFRFAPAPVAAICVGLVALVVSLIYDGRE